MRDFSIVKLMLLYFISLNAHGQTAPIKPENKYINQESQAFSVDEERYSEESAEALINLSENPLNLNQVTREELLSLSLLSVSQINNFFNYLTIHGKLISIYELQAIPEFDLNTIRSIRPLVTIHPSDRGRSYQPLGKRILKADNHYLVLRLNKTLEQKSGFDKNSQSAFAGSPYHWLVKYRSSKSKDFSLGLTIEKDPGEKFSWQPENHQYGPDFLSFHFTLRNQGNLKNLTIGDYKLQFGQGALFAAGFYPGKGLETITSIRRSDLGIMPYTSTSENGFLRGIAATYQIGRFSLTPFFSGKRIDANLTFDSLRLTHLISSIPESGLHRTPTEINRLKSVKEHLAGINIGYLGKDKNLRIGQMVSLHQYNLALIESNQLYKKFLPKNNRNIYLGHSFSYNWQNFYFFGESVFASRGGYALVLGALGHFTQKIQLSLLFRKYHARFYAPYGGAFSENTANNNETGIYWGLKLLPIRNLNITAFMDIFQFPWLKFGVDRPSVGCEYLIAFAYGITRHTKISALLRQEKKDTNFREGSDNLNRIVIKRRVNYQLRFDHNISQQVGIKTNLQWSSFEKAGKRSNGFSVSQDLNFNWRGFRISNRIMLFETEDFDNRHYRYERDLLYALSIPAFSGNGYRYYTMFQAKIIPNLSCWIRLARTIYFDRPVIGSGPDRISADHKTEIRCQVKYAF